MTDPQEIAAGLTPELFSGLRLLSVEPGADLIVLVGVRLSDLGLVVAIETSNGWYEWTLTPLGREVAQHLEGES